MIFQKSSQQIASWKQQMHDYQKNKRTKKPFGKSMPHTTHVTHQEIKTKENKFDPILQLYKNKEDEQKADTIRDFNRVKSLINHIKNIQKYQKNYDIVNLHEAEGIKFLEKPFTKKLGPIRNAYNVINNQKLPDFYFKNRDLQISQERQKNLIDYHKKEFDIITGNYKENNEQKIMKERQREDDQTMKKYWKTHNYDPVYGKFYDTSKQQAYQKQIQQVAKLHGKNADKKLPPSYIYREPLILDFQKPLPQTLLTLDEKQQARKRKYQLKYIVQDEYGNRNIEEEDKQQKILKNRVHDGRLLDEKAKQFDIITNRNYPNDRVENLYNKKPKISCWEEFIKPTDNQPKLIKSSGFK